MAMLFELVLNAGMLTAACLIALWIGGAIYFDVFGASWTGVCLGLIWSSMVGVIFVFWQPVWQPFVLLLVVWVTFKLWWFRLQPSHDRDWESTVAVLPQMTVEGDLVTIHNLRNFQYRSLTDFDSRYETRTCHLSNLRRIDVIFFNWGIALMSHPVMVFDFGPDGRVCISIEVRFRKGQQFSILRSLYRQQELIFLVCDERDAILRRTKYGPKQVAHLYSLCRIGEDFREAFVDYLDAINRLYEKPEWYHGVWANCTTSFYRLPHTRWWLEWRILANGRLDRALYRAGRLDRSVPFDELKRTAYLNDIANNAPEDGFGDFIRSELEKRRHAK